MKQFADEIDKVRVKLNELINQNADYSEIYKVSVELDELITKFYEREERAS